MRVVYPGHPAEEAEANTRLLEYHNVQQAIQLGLVTADNIGREERYAIQSALAHWPAWEEVVDPDTATVLMTGEEDQIEGKTWCFATSRNNHFGVFSLDPSPGMRMFIEGAVFHLWPDDFVVPVDGYEGRRDYTDLCDYLTQAAEFMYSTGERV